MDIVAGPLSSVLILKPKRFPDARGFFSESYNKARLAEAGLRVDFVQDNIAYCKSHLTLRGLHFQEHPFAQAKLVGVVKGRVLDVIVDLRHSSPSFGKHFAVELSAAEGNQIFVPIGFAHGFITHEPETLVTYKVSNYYSPGHDRGVRFNDPVLNIDWGGDPNLFVISSRDTGLPSFDPSQEYFA
jgi:dTDP-4-dehydrorhamnose 3,5-epimerase